MKAFLGIQKYRGTRKRINFYREYTCQEINLTYNGAIISTELFLFWNLEIQLNLLRKYDRDIMDENF